MSQLEFGTDGYRGEYNESTAVGINPQTFYKLTYDYCQLLHETDGEQPTIILGRDTRTSGQALGEAVCNGAIEAGAEVWDLGISPTPVTAWLAKENDVYAVSITASHNPNKDNGYKPFLKGGIKPSREFLDELTKRFHLGTKDKPGSHSQGAAHDRVGLVNDYLKYIVGAIGGEGVLEGQTIILDGANGAAYDIAPRLYRSLGATVVEFACNNLGERINTDCGAANLKGVKSFLEAYNNANPDTNILGVIANDGDADRVMALDKSGRIIDGNYWMQQLASGQKGIVGTIYTNSALRQAVTAQGVEFHECPNGDSYVTEKLLDLTRQRGQGFTRGGEFTGHLIDIDHLNSGDGLYMGAWLATKMTRVGASFEDLRDELELWPEQMKSIHLSAGESASAVLGSPTAQEAINRAKDEVADNGRIIVRASGTEPLIRVWGEARDEELLDRVISDLTASLRG